MSERSPQEKPSLVDKVVVQYYPETKVIPRSHMEPGALAIEWAAQQENETPPENSETEDGSQ